MLVQSIIDKLQQFSPTENVTYININEDGDLVILID